MSNVLKTQPTALSAACAAVLNVVALLGPVQLSGDEISAINLAVIAVLGLFVHQSVTPVSNVVAYRGEGGPVAGPAFAGIENGQPVDVNPPSAAAVQSSPEAAPAPADAR